MHVTTLLKQPFAL